MSVNQRKIHFDVAPPAYSPPPAYMAHSFDDSMMSFAQKERIASMAEAKLGYLVSQKRREPSLRQVLLHASFLERVLDNIEATAPESYDDEPMIDETYERAEMMGSSFVAEEQSYDSHQSLPTIAEVDEMEIDEEEEDEDDMPPLKRTPSHRPVSPVSDDDDDISDDSDDELPSPPPVYSAGPDHPLFNLFEVREKARRDDLTNHFRIEHNDPSHMFLMNDNLVVAA